MVKCFKESVSVFRDFMTEALEIKLNGDVLDRYYEKYNTQIIQIVKECIIVYYLQKHKTFNDRSSLASDRVSSESELLAPLEFKQVLCLLIQLQQTLIRRNSDVLKNGKLFRHIQAKYRAILHQDYQVMLKLMELEKHPDDFDQLVYSF